MSEELRLPKNFYTDTAREMGEAAAAGDLERAAKLRARLVAEGDDTGQDQVDMDALADILTAIRYQIGADERGDADAAERSRRDAVAKWGPEQIRRATSYARLGAAVREGALPGTDWDALALDCAEAGLLPALAGLLSGVDRVDEAAGLRPSRARAVIACTLVPGTDRALAAQALADGVAALGETAAARVAHAVLPERLTAAFASEARVAGDHAGALADPCAYLGEITWTDTEHRDKAAVCAAAAAVLPDRVRAAGITGLAVIPMTPIDWHGLLRAAATWHTTHDRAHLLPPTLD